MTTHVGRDKRRGRAWVWWALAGAALAITFGSVVGTWPTTEPGTVVLAKAHPVRTTISSATLKSLRRSLPVRLVIPSIHVSTSVGIVGLQPNHQVQVPQSIRTVSWYRYGPTPGQVGSSVVLGHVDSRTRPGVFFELKTLQVGATITVTLADRVVTHFVVRRVVEYSKTSFPDRLIYGSHGTRSLNLITCGGVFDHTTGHYESNIVVFTQLVGVTAPKKPGSTP